MTNKDISYYIHCFTHLKRDMKNGGAPHKPILLLSMMRLFEKGIFTDSQIFVLPELVASFKSNWTKLVVTNHFPIFALPFYHLYSEPFWRLVANAGCEKWIESKSSMRSFGNLTTAVKYALIDKEIAKMIGSRMDYVRRVLVGFEVYRVIEEEKNFYSIRDLNDKSFYFNYIVDSLNHTNIRNFLGVDFDASYPTQDLSGENLSKWTHWLFEKTTKIKLV